MTAVNYITTSANSGDKKTFLGGPLGGASSKTRKDLNSGLTLTSLVDCFSVLVIYLLVATSIGGVEMATPKTMQLPKAAFSDLLQHSTIVRVEANKYFVNNKLVSISELVNALRDVRNENTNLVIQADRRLVYSQLNPIVLSGLSAGFEKIQFAVLKGEKK
jgi:biopolymer transport protein ExbD